MPLRKRDALITTPKSSFPVGAIEGSFYVMLSPAAALSIPERRPLPLSHGCGGKNRRRPKIVRSRLDGGASISLGGFRANGRFEIAPQKTLICSCISVETR